ncbi:MAG TPA: PAS domain S-box protein, partial [Thermoanaerobaculia bacterium]|nr:PAS domain S-box protein [Thermoanaerobaculia bacterium]
MVESLIYEHARAAERPAAPRMVLAALDRSGIIRAVNEAWELHALALGGAQLAAAVGEGVSYFEVCRRSLADGCEQAREVLCGLTEVLAGRRQQFTLEYPCPEPGRERWFLLLLSPLPAGQGAFAVHIDITERRDTAQQVVESDIRYRTLLDSASDIISIHSRDSTFLYASPACEQHLGFRSDELVGHPVFEFLHPDDRPHASERHLSFLGEGGPKQVVARWRCRGGGYRWMESALRHLPGDLGERQVISIT